MDRRKLYEFCCDCKFAVRNKGGNPTACLISGPRIQDGNCVDFTFWWSRPPKRNIWPGIGAGVLSILTAVPIVGVGIIAIFLKFLKWIAPSVNKDALPLYFPKIKK
jgi:hypothetical protein